jgi:hypothetical protein
MRGIVLSCFVICAVLLPNVGTAQVFSRATPPPIVNAANAEWQINGEPIFFAGNFYYPAGPSVFFDGNVMTRTGIYQGIALYSDTTLEPWSIVYVPVGGNVMRPYERLRAGELAGTTGSRVPSFPVRGPSDPSGPELVMRYTTTFPDVRPESSLGQPAVVIDRTPTALPPSGPTPLLAPPSSVPARTVVESIPRPTGPQGIWIEFEGSRWYHTGNSSVSFDAQKFEPVGNYRGFPVYREKTASDGTIYVASVTAGGPLTPYVKR